jgi:hypothetical protein
MVFFSLLAPNSAHQYLMIAKVKRGLKWDKSKIIDIYLLEALLGL